MVKAGRKATDLTGQRFGWLTVLRRGANVGPHAGWIVRCDCGSPEKLVAGRYLRYGKSKHCGCPLWARQPLGV